MNKELPQSQGLLVSQSATSIKPLSLDADYPPLLRELAEVVEGELKNIGIELNYASAVAETVAEHVRERFGGQPNYWPKGNTLRQRQRRAAMWADFTGNNHVELATKYGVCVQQVYRMLATARAESTARTQRGLFEDEAG
ncbi:hypothetical protein DBR47_00795 [Paucibacter sp. KBW04]|uniref:Mor transcription activator family protein n=1 Tax=Paucibacter sp. KBW04 TaxID=2153361 RepID=UPI000F55CDAB|nr:Mor transcription activator family protein [Paucibacter sp. KBW04]RQO63143.1 hypothetical protein DBR47_00795 [Paucibacter sp. KBW04]